MAIPTIDTHEMRLMTLVDFCEKRYLRAMNGDNRMAGFYALSLPLSGLLSLSFKSLNILSILKALSRLSSR